MSEFNSGDTDAEIRCVCTILERVAKQYADGSQESEAIVAAAEAFIVVRQNEVLAKAYRRLKAAYNGEIDDDVLARMRSFGIDTSDFEDIQD